MDTLKKRYQVQGLLFEDLLSFTHSGQDLSNQKPILVTQYKAEFLDGGLIKTLVEYLERCIALDAPHMMRILDHVYEGDDFVVIYDASHGAETLHERLSRGTVSAATKYRLVGQILDALAVLSSDRLCHGSLNLNTVWIDEHDGVYLKDPIVNAIILRQNLTSFSVIDECIFIAPEFLQNRVLGIRNDIYAVGILAYFLFTNNWPYPYTSSVREMKQSLLDPMTAASEHTPEIPEFLDATLSACLSKDVENRIQNIDELKLAVSGSSPPKGAKHDSPQIIKSIAADLKNDNSRKMANRIKAIALACGVIGSVVLIYLTYMGYLTAIPKTTVPDIIGVEQYEAQALLKKSGLKSEIVARQMHPSIPSNHIVDTKPPIGREIKQSRVVKLFVSKGAEEKKAPNFLGRTVEQGKALLVNESVTLEFAEPIYSYRYPEGVIVSQSPSANAVMEIDQPLVLTLSKGYPIELTVTDAKGGLFSSNSGKKTIDLRVSLQEEWPTQNIVVDYNVDNETKILYQGEHTAGDIVDQSLNVKPGGELNVYFDQNRVLNKRINQ